MANEEKLKAAIAYLVSKRAVGKVKLFKLLYLADFAAYAELGASITGDTYQNFEMGPVPVALWKDFDRIVRDCADITLVDIGAPQAQQLITAKDTTYPTYLSGRERSILDQIYERYGDLTGADLKRLTHQEVPYLATERDEIIPYFMAGYRNARKPSADEIEAIKADDKLMASLRKKIARRRAS